MRYKTASRWHTQRAEKPTATAVVRVSVMTAANRVEVLRHGGSYTFRCSSSLLPFTERKIEDGGVETFL